MSDPADAPAAVPRLDARAWRDPAVLVVTGLGSGFARPAPGTWGSLVAAVVWWLVLAELSWPVQLAVMAVVFVAGCHLTAVVGRRYGVHDDPAIVVDEFVGVWLALLAAPATWAAALAGFLVFRVLDIAKVGPVGWVDRRVPGAAGVMLDDVVAGGLALLVLQLAYPLLPGPLFGVSA
ncbi:MAG: phosphatidylglycerophosphatase A [bacterium]